MLHERLDNDAMVLMLLQPTDDDDGNDALDALDPDGEPTAVYGVPRSLVGGHAKLCAELVLVAGVLAVHEPGAAAPAQDGAALARDPALVVGRRARPHGALEQHLAVGERDGHKRRPALPPRDRVQARVQQVAQLVGVLRGEGLERDGVACGLDLFGLAGVGVLC